MKNDDQPNLKELIHETDWDNLIILDACRYDFFNEYYHNYPNLKDGKLKKARSVGTATREVVPSLFTGRYNWELFSAHPAINSLDVQNVQQWGEEYSWQASNHFPNDKIYDLWKTQDKEDIVASPERVRKEVAENYSNRKSVIWFMQPHEPHIGDISVSLYSVQNTWELVNHQGRIGEDIAKLYRLSYKQNLLRVLYSLYVLLGDLKGKTIITSDHGELLFDNGLTNENFGHPSESQEDKLRNIPWLEIDASKCVGNDNINDEQFIRLAYKAVLKRDVDEEGLKNYKKHLNGKLSRKNLINTLMNSDEYKDRVQSPNKLCGFNEGG